MVKFLPEFEYFTVFLKIETLFLKFEQSRVTDYAALKVYTILDVIIHVDPRQVELLWSWEDPKQSVRGPSTYFTEGRTDLPREAIGPNGSNCFSRRFRTSISKGTYSHCDFSWWDMVRTLGPLPRGGTLVFHTYVGPDHFWGFKILNFNIFGGFQKNEYFWGYEDFVDIFGGSSQNWTIFRGHFYAF